MGAKLFQKAVSKFAVVAILNAFQVQPSKAFEIRIPNPLALGAEALGIKLYKFSPAYTNGERVGLVLDDGVDMM